MNLGYYIDKSFNEVRAEGKAEGFAEGRASGLAEGEAVISRMIREFKAMGKPLGDIAEISGKPLEYVQNL